MGRANFDYPVHNAIQDATRKALEEVESIERALMTNPALGGKLQEIVARHSLEVASLNEAAKSGHRAETNASTTDAFGRPLSEKVTKLQVTIPYTGDEKSFHIRPSTCNVISADWSAESGRIILVIPDDDTAQAGVDGFIVQVKSNLERLRGDWEQGRQQVEREVRDAAENRRQKIIAENGRDSKLDFPIG
jgi:hypothetical protein